MCPVGCAGCVRTVDFVEPFRARLSGGCVDCVRECFGRAARTVGVGGV